MLVPYIAASAYVSPMLEEHKGPGLRVQDFRENAAFRTVNPLDAAMGRARKRVWQAGGQVGLHDRLAPYDWSSSRFAQPGLPSSHGGLYNSGPPVR